MVVRRRAYRVRVRIPPMVFTWLGWLRRTIYEEAVLPVCAFILFFLIIYTNHVTGEQVLYELLALK